MDDVSRDMGQDEQEVIEIAVAEGELPPEGAVYWLPWEQPDAKDIEYEDFDPLPTENPFGGDDESPEEDPYAGND